MLVLLAYGAVLALACTAPSGPESLESEPSPGAVFRIDERPLIKGPKSAEGNQAILGTSDLGVGVNRVGFVLTSPVGLITDPTATVSSFAPATGAGVVPAAETVTAVFRPWPYGTRGLYTTTLAFDHPGAWSLEIAVAGGEGGPANATLVVEVAELAAAPAVGSPAPLSQSKTVEDVERPEQLTTGSLYDSDLYRTTIAEALVSGLPTVVVFASPAFCTNAVCGPQVEVLQQLKDRHRDTAHFIHVDLYDNPEEIQGDLSRARISPTVEEWRLPSTEWTFVLDRSGVVSARFEAFATMTELEEALAKVF